MGKTPSTQRFFQKLYVDFLGPYPRSRLGHIGIFIVIDHFSKFPFLVPVRKFTADNVVRYLEKDLFHTFGVPETIVSDNGSQFRSQIFNQLLKKYGVGHMYTAVHAPQANASERVNRTVLSAIKSYISTDQKDWDTMLSNIGCSLRSSIHSAIGTTPFFLAFGQHMITNGSTYSLLRQLSMLDDREVCFNRSDSLQIASRKALTQGQKQFERNEKAYNLRSREVSYREGQEVFRRNFKQSEFKQGYNAKLAPTFIKSRVRRKLGKAYYELEDMNGKLLGIFHAKDLKQ